MSTTVLLRGQRGEPPSHWVAAWAAAPVDMAGQIPLGAETVTLREIVHLSAGGSSVRVLLTNEFGVTPLTIDGGTVAPAAAGGRIDPASARPLRFAGSPSITMPPGALAVSDPIRLDVQAQTDLAVSFVVPVQQIPIVSGHLNAYQTSYMAPGHGAGRANLPGAKTIESWPLLKGLEVRHAGQASAIVCLGDSITEGSRSTVDANARWTDVFARRLLDEDRHANRSVLNLAIGGNAVLSGGFGPSAQSRFDRDVLGQTGVSDVIVLEGVNDVGNAFSPLVPGTPITLQELIAGYLQLAERAHAHHLRIYGGTLIPYGGSFYDAPAGERIRAELNAWIRTTEALDGVIDFDKAVHDPAHPEQMAAWADSGDHLHPSDAGYRAMGEAINLRPFSRRDFDRDDWDDRE